MNVNGVGSSSSSSSAPAGGLSLGPDQFLVLLMAELQHQDPLSPMDTHAMVQQLSTIEMVSENRATRLSQEFTQALGLMDRQVTWQDPESGELLSGRVSSVAREGSEVRVVVGEATLKLEQILAIFAPDA